MTYHYLAGPMRGYDEFNFPAFKRSALALRKHGIHIASPAEKDEDDGFDWAGSKGTAEDLVGQGFKINIALLGDIEIIAADLCDGVICLNGWQNSSGAKAETAFAWAIGKPVRQYFEPSRANGFHHELIPVKVPVLRPEYVEAPTTRIDSWED
jgi:nucleoside 2-deoxyribosyltransferase